MQNVSRTANREERSFGVEDMGVGFWPHPIKDELGGILIPRFLRILNEVEPLRAQLASSTLPPSSRLRAL